MEPYIQQTITCDSDENKEQSDVLSELNRLLIEGWGDKKWIEIGNNGSILSKLENVYTLDRIFNGFIGLTSLDTFKQTLFKINSIKLENHKWYREEGVEFYHDNYEVINDENSAK